MTSSPESHPNTRGPQPSEPLWLILVVLGAAGAMALILWFSPPPTSVKKQPTQRRANVRKAAIQAPSRRIRVLPPRFIRSKPRKVVKRPQPRRRVAPTPPIRRTPVAKRAPAPRKLGYNRAKLFYPLPFDLLLAKRDEFYKKEFAASAKLKRGIHEKLFLTELHKELDNEAKTRAIRSGVMRLHVHRYLRYRGHLRYRKLGFLELQILETLLQKYLTAGGPIDAIPTDHSTNVIAVQLAAHSGFYPLLLRNIGVKKGAKTLTQKQRFWLRTLFMARWFRVSIGHYPLPILMGNELYTDYNKARFLFSRNMRKRIFYARELKRLNPSMPHYRVLGWLWVQLGRTKLAVMSLRDALKQDPKDKIAQRLLDTLLKSPS